ncbi:MAG TPA: YfcE family phosphodiesterase [Gemmataceae bacterium]|jgi:putative phosphoesterase|nr:YfcE family phosphodiesterase [Gemmataceae bacterium]
MRILLLADIHGNWPALQAIQEPYDLCLCLGDLVDYALEPAACVDWVRRYSAACVRGNHDHGAAHDVPEAGKNGYRFLSAVTRPITRKRLSPEALTYLARLPLTKYLTADDARFMLVHATPRNALHSYGPPEAKFWEAQLEGVDAEVICVGHSHEAFVLPVGDKLVINPGSVGFPRDGDPRASYAVIENRRVEIKRIEYPVENTVRIIQESELPDTAKLMLAEALQSGGAKKEATKWG